MISIEGVAAAFTLLVFASFAIIQAIFYFPILGLLAIGISVMIFTLGLWIVVGLMDGINRR